MIYEINKDILLSDSDYIAHQCNCVSEDSKGLAANLFLKYYGSSRYLRKEKYSLPGTIEIFGNIINLYAQVYPGAPNNSNDSYEKRKYYFSKCLDEVIKIDSKSISFPYNIGCGLAKGNWNDYYSMILEFSSKYKGDVFIHKI